MIVWQQAIYDELAASGVWNDRVAKVDISLLQLDSLHHQQEAELIQQVDDMARAIQLPPQLISSAVLSDLELGNIAATIEIGRQRIYDLLGEAEQQIHQSQTHELHQPHDQAEDIAMDAIGSNTWSSTNTGASSSDGVSGTWMMDDTIRLGESEIKRFLTHEAVQYDEPICDPVGAYELERLALHSLPQLAITQLKELQARWNQLAMEEADQPIIDEIEVSRVDGERQF
jgi:hypothetical protein